LSPMATHPQEKTQNAVFSIAASPPIPSTYPNIIVGQVSDSQGRIVESAILEIQVMQGRPVRALRSNKLGHFMIATPLANGDYKIITEKNGLEFDTITVNVKGEIVKPIIIVSKNQLP
jgi:hypothetical protein